MDIVLIFAGFMLLVIFLAIVYKIIAATMRVVPQEERLVIYRLGRFHRIAGPGPVQIIPKLDRVVRTLKVRDHPLEITVERIFAFGVGNDFTLNLWCSSDLVRAARGDHHKLVNLVQISEAEQHRQIEVKMREALVRQVADLQKRMPLPDTASTFDGVIALAPGSDRYNQLLEGVTRELEKTLPSVGVVLNTSQPITLTNRGIPDAIIKALQRKQGRDIDSQWLTKYANELREQFPDVSQAMLAQVLAAIEGVDTGNIQRLLLEQDGGVETDVEFEMPGDGSATKPNVITKPKRKTAQTAAKRQAASPETASAPSPRTSEPLTRDDLAVLKRVPRRDDDQRLSA